MINEICNYIDKYLSNNSKIIIAIDGKSGSGKTTLANYLKNKYQANVIHCDDYFLPSNKKTSNRLNMPGGNIDYERLKEQVIDNLNSTLIIQKYNCKTKSFDKKTYQKNNRVTIIEGSYSMHPFLNKYYHLSIFIDLNQEKQIQRILSRNGKNRLNDFINKWIPLEGKYFKFYKIKQQADFIITGDDINEFEI